MADPTTAIYWHDVAKIAGVLLVTLLGIIGTLLGILMKRQNQVKSGIIDEIKGMSDIKSGIISELREFQSDVNRKMERETEKREQVSQNFLAVVESHRSERKAEIKSVLALLEAKTTEIIGNFREYCDGRQQACSSLMRSELGHQKERITLNCDKIRIIQEDRRLKWDEQGRVNYKFLNGPKDAPK